MSEENLYRIVYASSGIREFSDDEIENILAISRRNNTRDHLTGMLLYRGGNFLQVLEGPLHLLENAMARIKQDPRHHGILIFQQVAIATRGFSDWTMGFCRVSAGDLEGLEGYSQFMESSFDGAAFREDRDFAYKMLAQFKNKMR